MKQASLETIAKKMKDLDFCMMVTQDGRGSLHSRPMSNNRQVEYDGDSWFYTYEDSNKVRQIGQDSKVSLIFSTKDMLFLECYGHASVVRQRGLLEAHWTKGLEQWFPQGIDTPGICLVRVRASRIHFWDKEDEGEYKS